MTIPFEDDRITLGRLIEGLDDVGDELTICAPPSDDITSDLPITLIDTELDHPVPDGMRYFLEVSLAKEVLSVWSTWRDGIQPTVDDACQALAYYSTYDAFEPAWPS